VPAVAGTQASNALDAFDRELDYVFETLRRLGAGPSDLEDLAQEVFVVLWRNWEQVDATRPLRPYLFGVAFRIVAAHRRRRGREVPRAAPELADPADDPETRVQRQQSVSLLLAALDRLPPARRAVVVMHDLDEVPIAEVAHRLSMTRFGAYARLRKGRSELLSALRRLLRADARP
jgi:RNA polymerase sigma-70 factor (ECF subfamily)